MLSLSKHASSPSRPGTAHLRWIKIMTEQHALVWEGGTVVAVRPVTVPEPRPGWVAVDVGYAGICGSDLHIAGGVCEACLAGRTNVCHALTMVGIDYPGGIAPRTVVPGYGIYPLPADVDLVAAALIEPLAVAVRAVRRSGLALGDRAHVVGAGPVGCLVGLLSTAAGATVTVSEPAVSRRKYAADLGLTIVDSPDDLAHGADVVFDASGHSSVAGELPRWLRTAGTAVIVGAYHPGLHGVDLLSVMFGEITIIGTRIYQRSDIEAAIALVTTGKFDAHRLISKVFRLDEAVAAIDSLRRGEGMKVLIEPGQARGT